MDVTLHKMAEISKWWTEIYSPVSKIIKAHSMSRVTHEYVRHRPCLIIQRIILVIKKYASLKETTLFKDF